MGWRAAFSTANRDCRQGKGLLDPWREWLKEQRESGNYNASRIWREMVARGLQAVKPSSGMLLPNGVKAGTHQLLLPPDFLQCPG